MKVRDLLALPEQLVRDHVPELARRARAGLTFHQAAPDRLDDLMVKKIIEEAEEIAELDDRQQQIDRMAAIYELLERMASRRKYSMPDLARRADELDLDKGPFRLGMVLIKTREDDRG